MPAQEHVVGHLGCGPDLIARFVDAGTVDGLDTSCVAEEPAPAPTSHLPQRSISLPVGVLGR